MSKLKAWTDAEYGRRALIARKLGISRGLVTDWLAGRREPTLDQAVIIEDLMKEKKPKA